MTENENLLLAFESMCENAYRLKTVHDSLPDDLKRFVDLVQLCDGKRRMANDIMSKMKQVPVGTFTDLTEERDTARRNYHANTEELRKVKEELQRADETVQELQKSLGERTLSHDSREELQSANEKVQELQKKLGAMSMELAQVRRYVKNDRELVVALSFELKNVKAEHKLYRDMIERPLKKGL